MSKSKSTPSTTKSSSAKKSSRQIGSETNPFLQYGLLAGILILTLLVYLPAFQNGFVWDDSVYIQRNPLIYRWICLKYSQAIWPVITTPSQCWFMLSNMHRLDLRKVDIISSMY